MSEIAPVDQAHRDRIRDDLDSTLFVEAGAGTGKTSSLVGRVLSLVGAGVPVRRIAAITFTEAAAAELRDRIRLELEARSADSGSADSAWSVALDDLDAAAICTLHAFAQRILVEHPIEVGLPPAVDVLDEVASQLAFADRWTDFLDRLYDDPGHHEVLLRAQVAGVTEPNLRSLAEIFDDNWDLVRDRPPRAVPLTAVDVAPLVEGFGWCVTKARDHAVEDDKLRVYLEAAESAVDWLADATTDVDRLEQLQALGFRPGTKGAKGSWDDEELLTDVKVRVKALESTRKELVASAQDQILRNLAVQLARFTIAAADRRRAEGRLEFHDLLVLARDLLRSHPEARAALHRKYSHLLIDEFQDTDPIQIELAVLIAALPESIPEFGREWDEVEVDQAQLFFVGDPKQSIYRFRRADIALFLRARDRFASEGAVPLVENFRTVPGIVEWVNGLFAQVMEPAENAQPEYRELHAYREDPRTGVVPVTVLGQPDAEGKADEIRVAEAGDVAATIVTMLDEGWQVVRDDGTVAAARLDDIAILIPSRLCLAALESELRNAEVPYRLETRSLVWNTQEVSELLAVLRAVDDPGDAIATVAALRSPAFGCGDDDLLIWYRDAGHWDYRRDPPDQFDPDHPVARGMVALHELNGERWWLPVSTMVERVARERRLFEFAFAQRRPRDVWRRLRWVIDQARAFTESGGGTLRDFLRWTDFQASDTSVAESVLPEPDDEAVRVLTIHGSKGREFPITVLAGMSTENRAATRGPQVIWDADGTPPEISLSKSKETDRFEVLRTAEEQMSRHERVRLLYVAATRARDHLVVSAYHKEGKNSFGKWVWDHCEGSSSRSWRPGPDRRDQVLASEKTDAAEAPPTLVDRAAFAERRAAALARQVRPAAMSATAIAHAAGADEVDPRLAADGESGSAPDQPSLVPTRRGRAGTAIGRATHAVLQHIDFDAGDDVEQLARAEAAAESVPDLADEIAAKARAALASEIVQVAARSQHWRELYVAAPLDGVVVEGYIDLLVRTPEGLVVVDYKTDSVRSDADVDAALGRYRLQGATYARLVETVVGEQVVDCIFVFLTPSGAKERHVIDLEAAKAAVSGLLGGPLATIATGEADVDDLAMNAERYLSEDLG